MFAFVHNKKNTFVLLSVIIFVGFLLRAYKFDTVPRIGATFDEFAWTWLGMNLIDHGVPMSWSPHPQYEYRKQERYMGAWFLIVKPYLEHPPLFGLVAGGFAKLNGVSDMFLVTTYKIRPLAIAMGVASIILLFLFIRDLYGKSIALFISALYATIPTVVIGSKLVQNENFLIPMWVLSLIFLHKYVKTGNNKLKYLSFVVAGILPLAKVPWFVASFSLSLILSYNKKWKDAFQALFIAIAFFSLFIVYGVYYDAHLFVNLFRFQLERYDITFSGIYALFTDPLLLDRGYIDGWIIMSWFGMFFLMRELKKYYWLILPFLAYFILFIFAIPNEPGHGWYRYPFYPFTISSLGIILFQEYKKPTLFSIPLILLTGLAILSNTWAFTFGFSYGVMRLFILMVCASFLVPLWFKKFEFFARPLFILWIAILILGNIWSVIGFIE